MPVSVHRDLQEKTAKEVKAGKRHHLFCCFPKNVQRLSVAATKLKKERKGSEKGEIHFKNGRSCFVQNQLCSRFYPYWKYPPRSSF